MGGLVCQECCGEGQCWSLFTGKSKWPVDCLLEDGTWRVNLRSRPTLAERIPIKLSGEKSSRVRWKSWNFQLGWVFYRCKSMTLGKRNSLIMCIVPPMIWHGLTRRPWRNSSWHVRPGLEVEQRWARSTHRWVTSVIHYNWRPWPKSYMDLLLRYRAAVWG